MNKWYVAAALLVVAIAGIVYVTLQYNGTKQLNTYLGKPIGSSAMKEGMLSRPLCIVSVVKERSQLREDVMNCGLEYYQSALASLPTKDIEFFGVESNTCMGSIPLCTTFPCQKNKDVKWSVEQCIKYFEKKNCYLIVVSEGNENNTNSYENGLAVYIEKPHEDGSCTLQTSS